MFTDNSSTPDIVRASQNLLITEIHYLTGHRNPSVGQNAQDCLRRIDNGRLLLAPMVQTRERGLLHLSLQLAPDLSCVPLVTPVLEFDPGASPAAHSGRDYGMRLMAELAVAANMPDKYYSGLRDLYSWAYSCAFRAYFPTSREMPRAELMQAVRAAIGEAHYVTNIGLLSWKLVLAQHLRTSQITPTERTWFTSAANDPDYFLYSRGRHIEAAYEQFCREHAGQPDAAEPARTTIQATDILVDLTLKSDYPRLLGKSVE